VVSDKDDDGKPIEPQFIEAAYALEPTLFAYRRREIGCGSTTAELIQVNVRLSRGLDKARKLLNP